MRASLSRKLSNFKDFHRLWGSLGDLFFPPRCILCQTDRGPFRLPTLCQLCWSEIFRPILVALPDPPEEFGRAFAGGDFVGGLRSLLTRAKFQGDLLALPSLYQIMEETMARSSLGNFDLVTHIPSHPAHLKQRGLALPALLARRVSRAKKIPWDRRLLRTVRSAPPQTSLSRKARLTNLKNTFVATGDLTGQRILVIDDVCTTGATGVEAIRAIKEQGSDQTLFLACARTPLAANDVE